MAAVEFKPYPTEEDLLLASELMQLSQSGDIDAELLVILKKMAEKYDPVPEELQQLIDTSKDKNLKRAILDTAGYLGDPDALWELYDLTYPMGVARHEDYATPYLDQLVSILKKYLGDVLVDSDLIRVRKVYIYLFIDNTEDPDIMAKREELEKLIQDILKDSDKPPKENLVLKLLMPIDNNCKIILGYLEQLRAGHKPNSEEAVQAYLRLEGSRFRDPFVKIAMEFIDAELGDELRDEIIIQRPDVNVYNDDGITPLMRAVANNNIQEVYYLLFVRNANPNLVTGSLRSPLNLALDRDNDFLEIAKLLITAGASTSRLELPYHHSEEAGRLFREDRGNIAIQVATNADTPEQFFTILNKCTTRDDDIKTKIRDLKLQKLEEAANLDPDFALEALLRICNEEASIKMQRPGGGYVLIPIPPIALDRLLAIFDGEALSVLNRENIDGDRLLARISEFRDHTRSSEPEWVEEVRNCVKATTLPKMPNNFDELQQLLQDKHYVALKNPFNELSIAEKKYILENTDWYHYIQSMPLPDSTVEINAVRDLRKAMEAAIEYCGADVLNPPAEPAEKQTILNHVANNQFDDALAAFNTLSPGEKKFMLLIPFGKKGTIFQRTHKALLRHDEHPLYLVGQPRETAEQFIQELEDCASEFGIELTPYEERPVEAYVPGAGPSQDELQRDAANLLGMSFNADDREGIDLDSADTDRERQSQGRCAVM